MVNCVRVVNWTLDTRLLVRGAVASAHVVHLVRVVLDVILIAATVEALLRSPDVGNR